MNTHQNYPHISVVFVMVALFTAFSASIVAAPGDLDLSFGGTGKVVVGSGYARSVAVQADGKIVLAGDSLIRLKVNGSLDTSFGGSGIVGSVLSSSDQGNSVAVQEDGKIVTVGYSNAALAVARFNPNGSRDTTFGGSGMVATGIGTFSRGSGVVVQPDGKIVVAGSATMQNQVVVFVVVRYNPSGGLDASFGAGGKVTTEANRFASTARSVALQTDGKILVVGLTGEGSTSALIRYHPNGTLDTTFGSNGIVDFPGFGRNLAVQVDGKIVIAGMAGTNADLYSSVWRYAANGMPDTAFGIIGRVTTGLGDARGLAIQQDGKIVAAGSTVTGYSSAGNDFAFFVARWNGNGSLDTTFHGTGMVKTDLGTYEDRCWGAALQTDGKIVAAGYTASSMAVVRYQGDAVTPFSAWKVAHLGQANPPDLGDPDGDGMSTLAEYGLASLPEIPNTAPATTLYDDPKAGRRLRMFVQRDPTHNDVTVEVQAAGDLAGPWTTVATSVLGAPFTGPGYTAGDGVTPGVKTVDVRDPVNVNNATQRFMRARVTH